MDAPELLDELLVSPRGTTEGAPPSVVQLARTVIEMNKIPIVVLVNFLREDMTKP
jgi:hypothetical protein